MKSAHWSSSRCNWNSHWSTVHPQYSTTGDQARSELIGPFHIHFQTVNGDVYFRVLTALLLPSLSFQVPVLHFKHRIAISICNGWEAGPDPGKSQSAPWDEQSWLYPLHILSGTKRSVLLTDSHPQGNFKGCDTLGLNNYVLTHIPLPTRNI